MILESRCNRYTFRITPFSVYEQNIDNDNYMSTYTLATYLNIPRQ